MVRILTNKQKKRQENETKLLEKKALATLRKLITLPEIRDLIDDLYVTGYRALSDSIEYCESVHRHSFPVSLFVTKRGGLVIYYDEDGKRKKVVPSLGLVRKFELTADKLEQLITELHA